MANLHRQMFYESRQSIHVSDSDPSNNPNTELNSVPEAAEIHYHDSPDRTIDSDTFDTPDVDGYKVAQFLIGRAMLDPDATVVPAS